MTDINDLAQLTATNEAWQLCYADEYLLVVNKPAHLLTVPGRHPSNFDCLISRVQAEYPTAQVVHRLDYDTSGLVILPLSKATLSHISKQFQARTISKFYEALVKKIQAKGAKVILCTPAAIGERTDHTNQQDGDLNMYCKWIRSFAASKQLQLVDLRAGLLNYNLQHNPENKEKGILTSDRVHLNPAGQQFVADAMWEEIKAVK